MRSIEKMRIAIAISICATLLISGKVNAGFIPIPGVVGTGTGNFNTIDPAYALTVTPQPIGGPFRFLNPNPAWGIDNRWIGPANGNITGDLGAYNYRLSFDLSGFNIDAITIQGSWATDNGGQILVNGVYTGLFRPDTPGIPITLAPFTLSSYLNPQPGIAHVNFLSGENTIDFLVTDTGTVPNPTGLLVIDVQSFAFIPEPNTLILLTTGFVGMLGYGWRQREKVAQDL